MLRTSPDKFAEEFNRVVPGAYRRITTQDVLDMTNCGLIGKYDCYLHNDIETVRAVLQYEELRQKRIDKPQPQPQPISVTRACKICGSTLPVAPVGKYGRRKEYCAGCESSRLKLRYRKWRKTKQAKINYMTSAAHINAS
jgi:hypothetical protein